MEDIINIINAIIAIFAIVNWFEIISSTKCKVFIPPTVKKNYLIVFRTLLFTNAFLLGFFLRSSPETTYGYIISTFVFVLMWVASYQFTVLSRRNEITIKDATGEVIAIT